MTPPRALLFIDMLGVRSRWQRGGREEAEVAFKDFRNLVAGALRGTRVSEVSYGIIETDAFAATCADAIVAVELARRIYQMAFRQTAHNNSRRYWFRGVILPRTSEADLRRPGRFGKPLSQVELAHYDRDLFDAIAIEKSGIKGMRLLVAKSLVTQDVSKRFSLDLEYLHLNRFKTLRNCHYGPQVDGTYLDFLWMVTDGEKERREMELLMSTRFRLSAKDPEEFAQAAATQLVFLEADAIIGSMLSRLKSEHARKDRQALHRGGAA